MKTAVLVSGMCRQFDIAVKSWKFLNDLDCDVYFSTWKKSVQSSKVLNMYIEEDITEDMILEHIPNAKVKIYDVNNFDFSCCHSFFAFQLMLVPLTHITITLTLLSLLLPLLSGLFAVHSTQLIFVVVLSITVFSDVISQHHMSFKV